MKQVTTIKTTEKTEFSFPVSVVFAALMEAGHIPKPEKGVTRTVRLFVGGGFDSADDIELDEYGELLHVHVDDTRTERK
jgi:hypothetical protein